MDRIERLRAFLHAAETGSFAAAGRRLSRSRDNVSKLVADLEADLGHDLFVRTTRLVTLTNAGEACLAGVRNLVEEFDRVEEVMRSPVQPLSGPIHVHAPTSFGLRVLSPCIGSFLAENPGVSISLDLEDRPRERLSGAVDLALRISEAPPADYIVRRLGPIHRGLFAAPAYLEAHGAPVRPADLGRHRCLHYAHLDLGERWQLYDGHARENVDIRGSLSSNTGLALADAAVAGAGVAILPHFTAQPHVESGALRPVLLPWRPAPLSLFALTPAGRDARRRVQVLLDFLAEAFGRDLELRYGLLSPVRPDGECEHE